MFSAVIPEHFSKNCMIISAMAAKILSLQNVRFLLDHLGPPCIYSNQC